MAATMVPLQSITLTASAASVTFSAIPQTYTDLVLRVSSRSTYASAAEQIWIRINSQTSGVSGTFLSGNGATGSSYRNDDATYYYKGNYTSYGGNTANTFGSAEFYFPNYATSSYKTIGSSSVSENNGTTAYVGAGAGLVSNTAAISRLDILAGLGDWAAGSTFHLYGIKNS